MLKRRGRFFWEESKYLRRHMKRTTKQYIIVATICIVVLGGAATFTAIMVSGQIRDKYAFLLANAHMEMEANKKKVYVARADIAPGDFITEDTVIEQTVYSSQPQDILISSDDIGKVALINISAGTQLLKSMLSGQSIKSELREIEYSVISVSTNIANNDTVDIRIMFPNGETYVVLSKKVIRGYTPDTAICHFWLDEEELLRMSAAIVDASLYTGSSLFVTKYIEPNIQDASVANYIPSLSILALLESDPNILERATQELSREVRKALENRLANSLNLDVSTIAWDINPNGQSNSIPTPDLNSSFGETPTDAMTDVSEQAEKNPDGESEGVRSSDDFFYYAEEASAKEDDIEYGE